MKPHNDPLQFDAPEVSLMSRITRGVNLAMAVAGTPLIKFVMSLITMFVVALSMTWLLRDDRSVLIQVAWLIVFGLSLTGAGALIFWLSRREWVQRAEAGAPRFGSLGGPRRRQFDSFLEISSALQLTFSHTDRETFDILRRNNYLADKELFHRKFLELGYEESAWPGTWARIEQTRTPNGEEFGKALRSGKLGVALLRIVAVGRLVYPLTIAFEVGYIWLLTRYASGSGELLPLLQFSLVGGLIISWFIYVNFTVAMTGELTILSSSDLEEQFGLPVDTTAISAELLREGEDLAGRVLLPAVSFTPQFIPSVRRLYVRRFGWMMATEAIALMALIAVQWPLSYAFSVGRNDVVNDFTRRMLIGGGLMPVIVVGLMLLGFAILQNVRRFTVLLATAIVLAVVPPIITYIVSGSNGSFVFVSSAITASIGCIGVAVADVVKENLNPGRGPFSPPASPALPWPPPAYVPLPPPSRRPTP